MIRVGWKLGVREVYFWLGVRVVRVRVVRVSPQVGSNDIGL